MSTLAKKFEDKFKEDILKLEGVSEDIDISIDRLYDTTNGYKKITQVADFIWYRFPNIFYTEIKSVQGNTFPLSNLTQYDKLLPKAGKKGVRSGAVVWFYDHDKVLYIPVKTFEKLKNDGKKSYNLKKYLGGDEYPAIDIPSKKLRTFMDSDYSVMFNLPENY